ncbi:alpha-1-macroglobulin-like isoform X2 [Pollicipes pollicipes]|uniref:alpha-1-macroglobulin-like isoform X2 n=1 Tax=Pollicipes pollicipes TaxID=41117 RepID=UPI00188532F3|nr:alpha-1-macroglobulin-like isoform X2 [Pollicipes pollicipes]
MLRLSFICHGAKVIFQDICHGAKVISQDICHGAKVISQDISSLRSLRRRSCDVRPLGYPVRLTGDVIPFHSGFLFTSPKQLKAGTSERVCVTLFNLPGPGRNVTLSLSLWAGASPWTRLVELIPDTVDADGDHCFDLDVPRSVTNSRGHLDLSIANAAGLRFSDESWVGIKPFTLLTLIQTDKPRYRPGDKVLIRVISLRYDLTPLIENIPEVWVTTPDNIRVAQWSDIKTSGGLIQLEVQLTEEPPLGRWTIHARTKRRSETHGFDVEEYVLPTFEVKVKSPTYLLEGEKTITVDVCAKYTFGQPLIGASVTVNVTKGRDHVSDTLTTDETGCASSDLIVDELLSGFRFGVATINATVEEFGTGLSQSETRSLHRGSSGSASASVPDNTQLFIKPGLPYYGRLHIKDRNGSPFAEKIVEICFKAKYKERAAIPSGEDPTKTPDDDLFDAYKKHSERVQAEFGYTPLIWETEDPERLSTAEQCRFFTADSQGRVVYFIPPQAPIVDSVDVRLTPGYGGGGLFRSLVTFFSPSNSYLTIDVHLLPDELPCRGDVTVQLLTSLEKDVPPMVYQVMSRSEILRSGRVSSSSLTLPVTPAMSPQFKLLVFFVLDSGEVVSDAVVLKVEQCFNNQVDVSWDKETARPGESASFTVSASPNSVCGVSAVDRSTELLGTGNQITVEGVFSQLRQFISQGYHTPEQVTTRDYCLNLQRSLVSTLERSGAWDEEQGQDDITFSRFRVSLGDDHFRTDRLDALESFDETGFLVMTNLALETRPCYKRVQAREIPEEDIDYLPDLTTRVFGGLASPGAGARPIFANRFGRPRGQAGVAQSGKAGAPGPPSSGKPAPIGDQVRDSFLEAFLFSIETIGPEGIKVLTQDIPDTITSWVGSAICSHPQDGFGVSNKSEVKGFKPFFTEVTLPYSVKRGEILNMSSTVFNFLDSSLSVYLELAASEDYSLADEVSPAGIDLCVPAGRSKVSHFPLTFTSLGEVNITVTARLRDGNCDQPNTVGPGSDTVIRPLVVKPEGFPQEETTSRFVCLDEGAEPYVEQIPMVAPEGLVPDSERAYFSVVGDLLGPSYDNLGRLMDIPRAGGEPNMLAFVPYIHVRAYLEHTGLLTPLDRDRTTNGMRQGYQTQLRYRRRDGSYSSFGREDREGSLWLTAFVVKSFKDASKYISIDKESIKDSEDWLVDQQQDDGCFPLLGSVIHKELKGGTERGGPAALTAFVMLALGAYNNRSLESGFTCLEHGISQTNKTLYSEVLLAYTHVVLGREQRGQQLVSALMQKAKTEGPDALFWEGDRHSIYGGSRAVDIEMTAYMVLSLVHLSGQENLEQAARAVKWINKQRNSLGGFISTQDTIVALQALTEFAKRTFSSELSTSVTVSAGGPPSTLVVDSSNRLLLQQEKVADFELPAEVTFTVSPAGCVIYRTSFRYSSRARVPKPAFSLAMTSEARPSRSPGSSYELEVCSAYIGDSGESERVVLEVEMPSGYIAVSSTLRSLRKSGAVRKYDFSKGKVTFTLSKVTEEKVCLKFRIIRENEVDGLKPSVVRVYDLFRPEDRNILEYELSPVSSPAA